MDYHFTAEIEKNWWNCQKGNLKWDKYADSFLFPFHKTVEQTKDSTLPELPANVFSARIPYPERLFFSSA